MTLPTVLLITASFFKDKKTVRVTLWRSEVVILDEQLTSILNRVVKRCRRKDFCKMQVSCSSMAVLYIVMFPCTRVL